MSTPEPDFNPFASPTAEEALLKPEAERSDMELIRHEHLKHEASIRSVGILYYIPAAVACLGFVSLLIATLTGELEAFGPLGAFAFLGIAVLYLLLALFLFWCGRGLRLLNRSARIPVIVLSSFGLLAIGLGTIINGYILYLVASQKGNTILSPEYQEIRRATPHIKYKSSLALVLLILFVSVLVSLVLGNLWLVGP